MEDIFGCSARLNTGHDVRLCTLNLKVTAGFTTCKNKVYMYQPLFGLSCWLCWILCTHLNHVFTSLFSPAGPKKCPPYSNENASLWISGLVRWWDTGCYLWHTDAPPEVAESRESISLQLELANKIPHTPSLVEGWCLRPQTPESSQDTGLSLAGVPQLHAYTGESTGASAESSSDTPHPPSEIKWQLDQRLWHSSVPCSLAVGKRSLGCPCFDLSNYW